MKLKAPDNFGSAVVKGCVYEMEDDGSIHADLAHVDDLRSFGFTDWVPLAPDDPRAKPEPPHDEFDALNRNGLFDWARAHNLQLKTPINREQQLAACRAHAALLASERAAALESAYLLKEAADKRAAEEAEAQAQADARAEEQAKEDAERKLAAQAEAARLAAEALQTTPPPPAPPPV